LFFMGRKGWVVTGLWLLGIVEPVCLKVWGTARGTEALPHPEGSRSRQ
jgi:hypothetical protein